MDDVYFNMRHCSVVPTRLQGTCDLWGSEFGQRAVKVATTWAGDVSMVTQKELALALYTIIASSAATAATDVCT